MSGSAFSMLSQFRKNRFKKVLSKEYASVCRESYWGTEDTAKPSKNLFGDNLSEKSKKISEENKLFKQASKFASDNYQSHSSKGFQPFRKGSRLFSQPIPQKAKAGSNPPSRRVVFRSRSKRGASNTKKEIYPLTGRTKFFQENWSKLTSDKTVLQTISGLQIPFWSCPKLQKIIPVTLPHSKEEYETLSQEIQSLKDKDAIREIPSTQAKFISRLFTVPKRSGGNDLW